MAFLSINITIIEKKYFQIKQWKMLESHKNTQCMLGNSVRFDDFVGVFQKNGKIKFFK